jgi:hypothetical protein
MNNLDVQLCSDKRIDRNWKGMTLLQVSDREIKAAINKLKNLKKKIKLLLFRKIIRNNNI